MKYIAALLFLCIFTLYAGTTSPYLQAGDSAEMATAAITLGVPHQPSYPLFVIPGYLISNSQVPYFPQLFNKDIQIETKYIKIYRSGLVSALFQALATVFFFLSTIELGRRLLRVGKSEEKKNIQRFHIILSLIATVLYAASQTVWLYATKPEVFSLNNLFVLILWYYALRWLNNESRRKVSKRYLVLFGIALTHHQTVILIAPALLVLYVMKCNAYARETPTHILTRWLKYPNQRKFNKLFPYAVALGVGTLPYFLSLWYISQTHPFMNWGEISTPVDLLRALFRFDYGTIGAYLTNLPVSTVVIDQIPFYLNHLQRDLLLYTVLLAGIGTILIYKKDRQLWIALLTFFLISGPLFIMYANFSLENDFSKATVIRFYMLSEIILIQWAYSTVLLLINSLHKLQVATPSERQVKNIGTAVITLLFACIPLSQLLKNQPHYDNLTYQYAKTVVHATENDAIILVTGDIPNLTIQYMQAVEGERKNRIIFSPGQFHLEWFMRQLKQRYPQLKIPPPKAGKQFTSPSQVIEANFGERPLYIAPEFVEIDPLVQNKYLLWPKNLFMKVEEKGVSYKLEEYIQEAATLYASVNIDEFTNLRKKEYQLESPLIMYYARHFYNIGAILNAVHRYDDAIIQLQRAIQIDPTFAESYKTLGYIYYYTEDFKDKNPEAAVQYFERYLQTAQNQPLDQIQAVQNAINQIYADVKKEQEEAAKKEQQKQKVATDSAEEKEATQSAN
jgi:hypothetical protein